MTTPRFALVVATFLVVAAGCPRVPTPPPGPPLEPKAGNPKEPVPPPIERPTPPESTGAVPEFPPPVKP
jgi:hypothetical protein